MLIDRLASSTVKCFPHLEGAVQRQFPRLILPVTAGKQGQEAKRWTRAANQRSYAHPSDYRFTLYPHREAGSKNTFKLSRPRPIRFCTHEDPGG
jgi:hypothetical protein